MNSTSRFAFPCLEMSPRRYFKHLFKEKYDQEGLVYELLNTQDTVLCSYLVQRSGELSDCQNLGGASDEVFQGLDNFE
jgi:hypothetical protein